MGTLGMTFALTLCVIQTVLITTQLVCKQLLKVNVAKSMKGLDAQ